MVLAAKKFLAYFESPSIDQRPVLAWIEFASAVDFTDVKTIVQDIRQGGPVESRLARLIEVSFFIELLDQILEGHTTCSI